MVLQVVLGLLGRLRAVRSSACWPRGRGGWLTGTYNTYLPALPTRVVTWRLRNASLQVFPFV